MRDAATLAAAIVAPCDRLGDGAMLALTRRVAAMRRVAVFTDFLVSAFADSRLAIGPGSLAALICFRRRAVAAQRMIHGAGVQ